MKQLSQKAKILLLIITLIIILGIIGTVQKGFEFDLQYQNSKRIEIFIQNEFTTEDIKQITNEVLGKEKVIIQKVEIFEDMVSIQAKEITEEQKEQIISKISEKYGKQLNAEETQIITMPHTRGRDLLKPYIMPLLISIAIILVYIAIVYKKLGIINVIIQTLLITIVGQGLLFSIISIARIPIGRLTIPLILVVYSISTFVLTHLLEKQVKTKKEKQEKIKK